MNEWKVKVMQEQTRRLKEVGFTVDWGRAEEEPSAVVVKRVEPESYTSVTAPAIGKDACEALLSAVKTLVHFKELDPDVLVRWCPGCRKIHKE